MTFQSFRAKPRPGIQAESQPPLRDELEHCGRVWGLRGSSAVINSQEPFLAICSQMLVPLLLQYLETLSGLVDSNLNCGPVLTWMEVGLIWGTWC